MLANVGILVGAICSAYALNEIACNKNHTLMDSPGDAVISVFIDTNYGPFCNLSSPNGFQGASTALFVIQALNKYDYVPGLVLGIKVYDTCHDDTSVYKQALLAAVDLDCVTHYDLGILVPESYKSILEPLNNFDILSISTYKEYNLSRPLIDAMVDFISTKFETVDLVLSSSEFLLEHFLESSKNEGVCVKAHSNIADLDNKTNPIIVAMGNRERIHVWFQDAEKIEGSRGTWVVLPLEDAYVDDLLPVGSYILKKDKFGFDLLREFRSVDDFLQTAGQFAMHSPYLLSIGRAIVEIAQTLQELQKRICPHGQACALPRFSSKLKSELGIPEVYEALHILPNAHAVHYSVGRKMGPETFSRVEGYRIEPTKLRVSSEGNSSKMPNLCLKKLAKSCRKCRNFERILSPRSGEGRVLKQRGTLKPGSWIPIYLTMVVCGTFACVVILAFVLFRFFLDEVLDGNPSLTVILILATMFTLTSVIPFCMEDETVGQENLNSRKIFVSTLSFGFVFSVMLSRALFLAFSTGGVFTAHINGYLQGLMVFFVAGVQISISTTYFAMKEVGSQDVARSLTFIALLGYDIFLLVMLFVVCCFITQIQRNYREGKCFFATVIGLSIVWAIWITCFVLVEPEARDTVVSVGTIATGYIVIIGVLIPRTYYMVRHLAREKDISQRMKTVDVGLDPRINTLARQSRQALYDHIHTAGGIGSTSTLHPSRCLDFYGTSSPNPRIPSSGRSPRINRQGARGCKNYGFDTEMREIETSYLNSRALQDTEVQGRSRVDMRHSKHLEKPRIVFGDEGCMETDVYVEERLSPNRRGPNEPYPSRCSSPRLSQTEETIREEDEEVEINRVTRF
ncbi:uncharacterized protein LOC105703657 [Orussus abietinus]|uniref:uncharacterized protein LOC105703657 n=1 Tax=Orussus abietinus TaxID=222816 RepID=UPI00062539D2|nr:uncharacterized protein LOC105703657 [Orussus abietinus]